MKDIILKALMQNLLYQLIIFG